MIANLLPIALYANLDFMAGTGGIETFLVSLIESLGRLEGPESYVIVTTENNFARLAPFLGPNQKLVAPPARRPMSAPRQMLDRLAKPVLRSVAWRIGRQLGYTGWPQVSLSDGFLESLGCEVLHFPYQDFVLTAVPTVYNPHDLQHLHQPQHFDAEHLAHRDVLFREAFRFARAVAVSSAWVKEDVNRYYAVHPDRIQVVPIGPMLRKGTAIDADPDAVLCSCGVEPPFALYPAMTWPHKNHERLLHAVALLRDRDGIVLNVVCSGHRNSHWPVLARVRRELRLEGQVLFPGLLAPEDLAALYRAAQFVVVPTLFEAASGPVYEAWHEGTAVACSNVTSLPQQAGDAALLFDPMSVEAIAEALRRLATDAELRARLTARGRERLACFSWERTATAYRALYRRVAGRTLAEEDRQLLAWDWMADNHPPEA